MTTYTIHENAGATSEISLDENGKMKQHYIALSFTTGVTDNFNSTTGLTQFIVPHEPSDTSLVYQCTVHSSMVGNITIV